MHQGECFFLAQLPPLRQMTKTVHVFTCSAWTGCVYRSCHIEAYKLNCVLVCTVNTPHVQLAKHVLESFPPHMSNARDNREGQEPRLLKHL